VNGSNIYYRIKFCKIMALKRRKGNYRLNQGGSADLDLDLLRISAPPHLLSISAPPYFFSASASSQHICTFTAFFQHLVLKKY
jgi:hypothetical protein